MNVRSVLSTIALVGMVTTAPAQAPKLDDGLGRLLFDPQMVLRFAGELQLQTAQRTAIVNAIKAAQGDILEPQLEMIGLQQDLMKLMEAIRVDEAAAMAQAGKLMELEQAMKKSQLLLLIRIKNALTPRQQEQLLELRKRSQKMDEAQVEEPNTAEPELGPRKLPPADPAADPSGG